MIFKTKDFRILRKQRRSEASGDIRAWYHVERKYKVFRIPIWKQIDFFIHHGEAIQKITDIINNEKRNRKVKLAKPEVVDNINRNYALLNARSDDDNIRELSKTIMRNQ